jgi:hypothetical protein
MSQYGSGGINTGAQTTDNLSTPMTGGMDAGLGTMDGDTGSGGGSDNS